MAGIVAAVAAQRRRYAAARRIQVALRRRMRTPPASVAASPTAPSGAECEAKTLSWQLSYAEDFVTFDSSDACDTPTSQIFMFGSRRGRYPEKLGFHWKHG